MTMLRNAALLCAAIFLTACAYGTKDQFASNAQMEQYTYASKEAPSLTLITMINNRTGAGGHTSILINGSQTVMYDPAGRWRHSQAPERHDVVYGMTPPLLKIYKSFHARASHHVVSQKIFVSPEVAERAIAASIQQGRAKDATCAINSVAILHQLPGFENLKSSYFPAKLMKRFGEIEGVVTTKYYENDEGQN
jgi:outer membrane lipoprotein-sorting protein